MPYEKLNDLPEPVKHVLPKHAQEIYQAAFNSAWGEYKEVKDRKGDDSREAVAHKVAWSAVKQTYKKEGDNWKRK
ncbi:MAG: ChaB family protein [Pseudomonadota bacterium]|nr:ChaB family protein [Pseudomonadota bacterium]